MRKSLAMRKISFILFLFILQSFLQALSANTKYYLKSLDISHGLSQNTVNCILQDKLGFMWFGTKEGLNRYDGLSFTVFKREMDAETSLGDSYIRVLYEDDNYRLWVGTASGLYIYMMKQECFEHLDLETSDGIRISSSINDIRRDKHGVFWISTEKQGLFSYDESKKTFKNYNIQKGESKESNIRNLVIDSTNRFWFMLNYRGLYYSDDEMKTVHQYQPKENLDIFDGGIVSDMLLVGKKLYIISNNSGLVELNTVTGRLTKLFSHDKARRILMRKIIFHTEDEMWIGSESGIYIFNLSTNNYKNLTHVDGDPYALSDNAIHSLYKDREGGIWAGTYFGGINYYPQQYTYFEKYYPIPGQKGLKGRRIREFCETASGKIFVGTEDGGLHLFDPATKEIKPFGDSSIYHNIHGLCLDGDNLWVGTYSGGLYIIDAVTGRVKKHYKKDQGNHGLKNNDIFALYKDKNNLIWIGTASGLQYYDRQKDQFVIDPDLNNYHIRDIKVDIYGNAYCATTTHGIFYREKGKNTWINYKSVGNNQDSLLQNNISSIFEDSRSQIWLTTQGSGFCKFLPKEKRFIHYTTKDGLSNNVTYQILEDDDSYLWISTNAGIDAFNPETKTFTSYKTHNGLPSKEFHTKSSLRSDTGLLYFGSINGFVIFDPTTFTENRYMPSLVLTDFLLFNKRVKVGEDSPLKESIIFSDKIELKYNQNSFSIAFSSLDYYASEFNQFQYMLEGFDENWIHVSNIKSVTYSNIKYGNYTFKVRASNSSGIWSEHPTSLEINILPPWWESSIAYTLYLLLFCVGIFIIYRYIEYRNKVKQERQLEQFSQEKEKEIYTAKIDFFTNIAHEIRTPLTLIKSPLENILRKKDVSPQIKEDLDVVNRNTNRLLDLTNQLLDFRKIEREGFQLSFAEHNISEMLRETQLRFNLLAKDNGLRFSMDLPEKDFHAVLDKESVIKIISNLFTNAIKNADSYINVQLIERSDEEMFDIIVQNDGPVIPLQQRVEIFKPFVQYALKEETLKAGTGLGLALARSLAELHKGTLILDEISSFNQFRLSLPIIQQELTLTKENTDVVDLIDEDQLFHIGSDNEKPLLLIVEDDKELLSYMERILGEEYNVILATNGKSALSLLNEYVVNLIISDVMMPQMDGFELCETIKSDLSSSHIPVVLLTAKTGLQSKIEGMELGADAYIEKPFDNEFLLATISNLLLSRRKMIESFTKSPHLFAGASQISKADEEFMKTVYDVIQKNIQNPDFNKENLADELNLSRSSLYRKIKGVFDISPNEFIRLERLKKAAFLLQEGETRISEVCYLVGFNSPSYFSKCFFKQYGILPKDFVSN